MRPPVPISTLPDAAKWMSELSGAMMTEREVLGHAFNFQWAAEHAHRAGEQLHDVADDDPTGPGQTPAMFTAERIIQVLIPADVEMRQRQWRIDGYADRAATREQRIVALDSYELFDLLTYDCAEVTLPRPTDPYEGDQYAELMLDGAVVTHDMTRIYARGLHILAAWWQATVGAAGSRMSTPPAALPIGMALAVVPARRQPAGGDALTAVVWAICFDLLEARQRVSPGPVMAELKARADDPDQRRKGPLLSAVAGGVKYEDSNGSEKELNVAQLQSRLGEWRKANTHG
jgi:hypothetical protein